MTNKKHIARVIFAHGAGQGMDSGFMRSCQQLFDHYRVTCQLFNFNYMAAMMEQGKRKPPERMPKLLARFQQEIDTADADLPLFIGGKSMGGRVATHLLSDPKVHGALCFGYPFHPPGKPETLRTEHLHSVNKPILILQGERDPFGKRAEIEAYSLCNNIQVQYLTDGEHSFKPGKRSGLTQAQNMEAAIARSKQFIETVLETKES